VALKSKKIVVSHFIILDVLLVHIHVAMCCSVLRCVVVCCSVLQCVAVSEVEEDRRVTFHYVGRLAGTHACCSVLQCVAVCCSVLQCVAVCCSV